MNAVSSEFSYGEGVIFEMKQTMNAVGLDDLGVDTSKLQGEKQQSPKERVAKADQKTTLQDF